MMLRIETKIILLNYKINEMLTALCRVRLVIFVLKSRMVNTPVIQEIDKRFF